jgi:hypothetical protein
MPRLIDSLARVRSQGEPSRHSTVEEVESGNHSPLSTVEAEWVNPLMTGDGRARFGARFGPFEHCLWNRNAQGKKARSRAFELLPRVRVNRQEREQES